MSSGGKGGSQTSRVEIPKYLETALKDNLGRSTEMSRLGYMPYYGPTVAAQSPQTIAAMNNNNALAQAYGMQTTDPTAGMPQAQNYGGVNAYSSGDIYDQSVDALATRRPGQAEAYNSFFINPQSGAASQYDTNVAMLDLIGQGVSPEVANGLLGASIYSDGGVTPGPQTGMSGATVSRLRALSALPSSLGAGAGLIADYYAGDYGKEGQPGVYSDDTFYRTGGYSGYGTPVRGSDFYSSAEAQTNASKVDSTSGGNAARGFTYGGW